MATWFNGNLVPPQAYPVLKTKFKRDRQADFLIVDDLQNYPLTDAEESLSLAKRNK